MTPTLLNLFFVQGMLQPEDLRGWNKALKRAEYYKNREVVLAKSQKDYAENPGSKKARYWKHRDTILEQKRLWRIENPEAAAEADRCSRRRADPERKRASRREYERRVKEGVPEYKILHSLRNRVRLALKLNLKAAKTRDLLGMEVKEFKIYLQGQFLPGMTWENYGPVWHIDHIRPCANFDLSDHTQQRECFNWSNMQPLFAEENLRKGDRV